MDVYVWPDYSWMSVEDFNENLDAHLGDDYMKVAVPAKMAVDDIETYLRASKVQDI